ncbi:MAG: hypothetical protein MI922_25835 [Bacteroidales bacterium]|nr:hypothetical protein [Bacteroidales bacterium]
MKSRVTVRHRLSSARSTGGCTDITLRATKDFPNFNINGFAYARGRWTQLKFDCVDIIVDCSTNNAPSVSFSAPASVVEGYPITLTAIVTNTQKLIRIIVNCLVVKKTRF